MCEHAPLSAGDCKPHKALRTTIKVFLRTEEKKREASRPRDGPVTPVTPVGPGLGAAALPVVSEAVAVVGEDGGGLQLPVAEQIAAAEGPEQQEGEETGRAEEGDGLVEKVGDDSVSRSKSQPPRYPLLTRTRTRHRATEKLASRKPVPRPT